MKRPVSQGLTFDLKNEAALPCNSCGEHNPIEVVFILSLEPNAVELESISQEAINSVICRSCGGRVGVDISLLVNVESSQVLMIFCPAKASTQDEAMEDLEGYLHWLRAAGKQRGRWPKPTEIPLLPLSLVPMALREGITAAQEYLEINAEASDRLPIWCSPLSFALTKLLQSKNTEEIAKTLQNRQILRSSQAIQFLSQMADHFLGTGNPAAASWTDQILEMIEDPQKPQRSLSFPDLSVMREIPPWAQELFRLACDLIIEGEKKHDAETLDRGIKLLQCLRDDSRLGSLDPAVQAWVLVQLGDSWMIRFDWSRDRRDLNRSAQFWSEAVESKIPASRIGVLRSLLAVRISQFAHSQDPAYLNQIIEELENVSSRQSPEKLAEGLEQLLFVCYGERFRATGVLSDFDAMVKYSSRAAEGLDRQAILKTQAELLLDICLTNTDDVLLRHVLTRLREGVEGKSSRTARTSSRMAHLLSELFERSHRRQDLDEAAEEGRAAFFGGSELDRAMHANNLADTLRRRYEAFGEAADLDDLIGICRGVTDSSPDDLNVTLVLIQLGSGHLYRFELAGDFGDLEAGLEAYNRASQHARRAKFADADDRRHVLGMIASNLSGTFRNRFRCFGLAGDLDHAIKYGEEALAMTAPFSHAMANRKINLALILVDRTKLGAGDSATFARAIELLSQAAEQVAHRPTLRAKALLGIGVALNVRYEAFGEASDLERAFAVLSRGLAEAPAASNPSRAAIFNSLGLVEMARDMAGPDPLARSRGFEFFRQSIEAAFAGNIEVAVGAALNMAKNAFRVGEWAMTVTAGELGRKALETLDRRQDYVRYRRIWFEQGTQLSSLHAIALLLLDQMADAVNVCERVRARLLVEALGRHSLLLTQLEVAAPSLFDQYQQRAASLKFQEWLLERSGEVDIPAEAGPRARPRLELVNRSTIRQHRIELDETVMKIRDLPGFESFLSSSSGAGSFSIASAKQPLVYLVAGPYFGFAVVCRGVDLQRVYLREMNWRNLENLSASFSPTPEALDQLGDQIIAPIAENLRRSSETEQVIIIPTGVLARLPLHAARYRIPGHEASVSLLDEFEVRYSPSAQVLADLRSRVQESPGPWRLLGVYDTAPQKAHLPFAEMEMISAALFHPNRCELLAGDEASVQRLLSLLDRSNLVEIAAHAHFESLQPLDSFLRMGQESQLRVRDLLVEEIGSRFRRIRLVVLSACSSAAIEDRRNPDEMLGLPFGFLQAGVPGIIGALWPINDYSSALLMARFHFYLADEDRSFMNLHPAGALRAAQKWLRDATALEIVDFLRLMIAKDTASSSANFQRNLEQEISYLESLPAGEQPFHSEPEAWAPFVYIGA